MPPVVQLMWVHLEEPDAESDVLDATKTRIWFRVQSRDCSGSTILGIPQKTLLRLLPATLSTISA